MKPSIIIKTYNPDPKALREILAGIEEEGMLYSLGYENNNFDYYKLAKDAAVSSHVQVGIGINGKKAALCTHKTRDIILFDTDTDYRLIGQNGARYVKGNPFISP